MKFKVWPVGSLASKRRWNETNEKIAAKMGFCPFFFLKKKSSILPHFAKLIREISLFWNSIFGQSSYNKLKILILILIFFWNSSLWNSSSIQGTRVPCEVLEFMELEFLEKIQVELEFHELEYFTWYLSSWNSRSKKKKKF